MNMWSAGSLLLLLLQLCFLEVRGQPSRVSGFSSTYVGTGAVEREGACLVSARSRYSQPGDVVSFQQMFLFGGVNTSAAAPADQLVNSLYQVQSTVDVAPSSFGQFTGPVSVSDDLTALAAAGANSSASPPGVERMACAWAADELWVAGGRVDNSGTPTTGVWRIPASTIVNGNFQEGGWHQVPAQLPVGVFGAASLLEDFRPNNVSLLLVGGFTARATPTNTIQEVICSPTNPSTVLWTAIPKASGYTQTFPAVGGSSLTLGPQGKSALLMGGIVSSGARTSLMWKLEVNWENNTLIYSPLPSAPAGRAYHLATRWYNEPLTYFIGGAPSLALPVSVYDHDEGVWYEEIPYLTSRGPPPPPYLSACTSALHQEHLAFVCISGRNDPALVHGGALGLPVLPPPTPAPAPPTAANDDGGENSSVGLIVGIVAAVVVALIVVALVGAVVLRRGKSAGAVEQQPETEASGGGGGGAGEYGIASAVPGGRPDSASASSSSPPSSAAALGEYGDVVESARATLGADPARPATEYGDMPPPQTSDGEYGDMHPSTSGTSGNSGAEYGGIDEGGRTSAEPKRNNPGDSSGEYDEIN